ncbi:hypothetical protein [Burkholderia sp. Ac-20353]|uniref:hypothetical protein n=1 Tax=Burkholderia sp. Ac-20353 TaxID=2703894 RepID=UPI00197B182A|nr:hypothetical protein [Burkholderia sp. Ac-20353]MBN3789719.1 hypothetical protein [Burkholderia sp. Ac-20353]
MSNTLDGSSRIPSNDQRNGMCDAHPDETFADARAAVAAAFVSADAMTDTAAPAGEIWTADCDGPAGAIMGVLRDLSRWDLAFVMAACGPLLPVPLPDADGRRSSCLVDAYRSAVDFIVSFEPRLGRRPRALTRRLIAMHFGVRDTYTEIADVHGIHRTTAARHRRAVSDALSSEERAIWSRLAARLRKIGAINDLSINASRAACSGVLHVTT